MANEGLVTVAAASATLCGGAIAAWVSARAQRGRTGAEAQSLVGSTYSQLVRDLRDELDRREAECAAAIKAVDRRCSERIAALEVEVVRLGGDPHLLS